jgi:hypothetical protein
VLAWPFFGAHRSREPRSAEAQNGLVGEEDTIIVNFAKWEVIGGTGIELRVLVFFLRDVLAS